MSAATVSNLNEKVFASVEKWRSRPLGHSYPCVCVDGIRLKRGCGRGPRERRRDGGDRRQRRRLPQGDRSGRGLHRVRRMLPGVPLAAEVPRAARRAHARRRQGRRHGSLDSEGLPGGGLPALYGALPPQRADRGTQVEAPRVAAMLKAIRIMESARPPRPSRSRLPPNSRRRPRSSGMTTPRP